MQQSCKICHQEDKFNFSIPDDIWRKVLEDYPRADGMVVCLSCFDDLAFRKEVDYYFNGPLYFVGHYQSFEFEVQDDSGDMEFWKWASRKLRSVCSHNEMTSEETGVLLEAVDTEPLSEDQIEKIVVSVINRLSERFRHG